MRSGQRAASRAEPMVESPDEVSDEVPVDGPPPDDAVMDDAKPEDARPEDARPEDARADEPQMDDAADRSPGIGLESGIEISEDTFPELDAVAAIQRGLHAFNQEMGGSYDRDPVTLLARAEDGTARGGLLGMTFWGWLFIDWLWLSRDLRGLGVGSELLRRAEAIGRERGCAHAYTDTFSFQAPDFWQRNGYVEFGRLDGMPAGHARIWFRKKL